MATTQQYAAKARVNAMIRMLEATTARAVEAIVKEAETAGCFVAGPPDEFGDPCYNLPADLASIGEELHSRVNAMLSATTRWTGEPEDKSGEYGA